METEIKLNKSKICKECQFQKERFKGRICYECYNVIQRERYITKYNLWHKEHKKPPSGRPIGRPRTQVV